MKLKVNFSNVINFTNISFSTYKILIIICSIIIASNINAQESKIYFDSAKIFITNGDTKNGIRCLTLSEQITHKELDRSDTATAGFLLDLANYNNTLCNYVGAEKLYLESIQLYDSLLGNSNKEVISALYSLANLYAFVYREYDCIPIISRILVIIKEQNIKDNYFYIKTLCFLSECQAAVGQFDLSEMNLIKAKEIFNKDININKDISIIINSAYSELFFELGILEKSIKYREKSVQLCKEISGFYDFRHSIHLHALANLYRWSGEYEKSRKTFHNIFLIEDSLKSRSSILYAGIQSDYANLLLDLGKFDQAIPLHINSLTKFSNELLPNQTNINYMLNSLENSLKSMNSSLRVSTFYNLLPNLWLYAKPLVPPNGDLLRSLITLNRYCRFGKLHTLSQDVAWHIFQLRETYFNQGLLGLTESEVLKLSKDVNRAGQHYISCVYDSLLNTNEKRIRNNNLSNLILRSKGRVIQTVFDNLRITNSSNDVYIRILIDSLKEINQSISQLYLNNYQKLNQKQRSNILDSLTLNADKIQKNLASYSKAFVDIEKNHFVEVDSVIGILPIRSKLIEYYKWDYENLNSQSISSQYIAVVSSKNNSSYIVNLGNALPIDSLVKRYRIHMDRVASLDHPPILSDKEEYDLIANQLYDLILKPLLNNTNETDQLFISPDASLNMLSFPALIDDKGNYLTEKYIIHHLSAGRDLINLKDSRKSGKGLLAIGDPDFNASVTSRFEESGSVPYATSDDQIYYSNRNIRSGCRDLHELEVFPLPYTRKEVDLVSKNWKSQTNEPESVYFGPQASEDNFKTEAPGKRVIHLATHGYFLEGSCNPKQQTQKFGLEEKFISENPLLLTGLLFSGANLHGEGTDTIEVEDGILSAYEVSAIDLTGTDMVVLSACESGLGKVQDGEGVYGLRRAFQMAGAHTVISALWQVPDYETASLMSELYQISDETIPEKMRRIQLKRIKELRESGLSDHPFSWAGFIATGDWR